ncbi:BOS complex subunit NOMO1 [Hetaerina americana]|uniref:BOS complex subunit NOMO1 n=1 Tax=Hetaerina americana TaxID=62018 RepID=UPI003A7F2165
MYSLFLIQLLGVLQIHRVAGSTYGNSDDILGCGGFLKSDIDLNFSRVEVKLYTKQGSLKYQSDCAPNNGYYFLPLYDTGEYILKIEPPVGWSFEPREVELTVDGKNDPCSQAQDINFIFKGFAVIGKVGSEGAVTGGGPAGVRVALMTSDGSSVLQEKETEPGGGFLFSPVAPGNYLLSASHPKWVLSRSRAPVSVIGDNGDSGTSLAVAGYEVKGRVLAGGEPVASVGLTMLHLAPSAEPPSTAIADENGIFIFSTVAPGRHRIVPQRGEDDIRLDVVPAAMEIEVGHGDYALSSAFEVKGFGVNGRLLSAPDVGVGGVLIYVDGKKASVTDSGGHYRLEDVQAGQRRLTFQSSDYHFPSFVARIAPDSPRLPIVYADKFRMCGRISGDGLPSGTSASMRRIILDKTAENGKWELSGELVSGSDGRFCRFLAPGSYRARAVSTEEEQMTFGLRFTPDPASFEVVDRPVPHGPSFSRVRCALSGRLFCLPPTPCPDILISLAPVHRQLSPREMPPPVLSRRGTYTFEGLAPGEYEVVVGLGGNRCWEKDLHVVKLDSAKTWAPPFRQTGYSASIISSHATEVTFTPHSGMSQGLVKVPAGTSRLCLPGPGPYDLEPVGTSCHGFEPTHVRWEAGMTVNLRATSHTVGGIILSSDAVDDLFVDIDPPTADGKTRVGPLVPSREKVPMGTERYRYVFNMRAYEGKVVTVRPWARELLFEPATQAIEVGSDCRTGAVTFQARKGIVLSGGTSPPVVGVIITILQEGQKEITTIVETNAEGVFSVGPLGGEGPFAVMAMKEGYVLTPIPGKTHWFNARRLAEVLVEVVEEVVSGSETTTVPLAGVLLSLSGAEQYRRNSATGSDGRLAFGSLSPSEYFLRPMMKEYSFDPPSEMVEVAEGATVEVRIIGRRVAFSCFGAVTSPCGDPEIGVVVEAVGVGGSSKCHNLQEEAVSERTGQFRIRGLVPTCTYEVRMKTGPQINEDFERITPAGSNVTITNGDVQGPKLVAFKHHRAHRTDVSLRVLVPDSSLLSDMRVSLIRHEGSDHSGADDADDLAESSSRVVHIVGLERWAVGGSSSEAGALVLFPPIVSDGRLHSLRLESIHGGAAALRATFPRPTVSFRADSFHRHFTLKYDPGVREEGVVGVGARVGGGSGEGPHPALPLALPLFLLLGVGVAHWRRLRPEGEGGGGASLAGMGMESGGGRGGRGVSSEVGGGGDGAGVERTQGRKKAKPRKT